MKQRILFSTLPAALVAAAVLLAPLPSAGQAKAKAAKATKAAPAPKGPDISGIWQVFATSTASSVEPHSPALGIQAGFGVITDPADGKIPYRPEARAKQQDNFKNRAKLDPLNKCYMPGVPRVMYLPFPIQILQTPKTVVLLSEYAHTTQNIFLTGQHLDGLELWMGDSRGRWEGNTLVVDVTQNNPDTWFDASGNHHSEALHVVERFTRSGPDTLQFEATFDDPKTYTRPWTMRLTLMRHQDPNYRLLEYDCNAYMEDEGGAK
ncbi:MAG: hypothetical protein ABI811_16045 [Acidobacteriota bacterium]